MTVRIIHVLGKVISLSQRCDKVVIDCNSLGFELCGYYAMHVDRQTDRQTDRQIDR